MAANQRKYEIADVREAFITVGSNVRLIASYLGCAPGTVYSYLRKYPELKAAYEAVKGGAVLERTQHSREAVESAIAGSWGNKAAIAEKLQVSRQTVDNYLVRWPDLGPLMEAERDHIVDKAENKLMSAVDAGDMRGILFVLETQGKNRGWSKRTELTGADGAPLLSPEVMRLLEAQGLDVSEVVRQFETMVRMQAAAKGAKDG